MDFAPCPQCGTFNSPEAALCVECRSPLDAAPSATTPPLTLKPQADPPPEEPAVTPPPPVTPVPASTAAVVRPARPVSPPRRGARAPRGKAIAIAAALVAIAVAVKLVVFPSTKRIVAGDFRATAPVWSPTGKHLAFLLEDKVGAHLAVFDFAAGKHIVVGDLPFADPGSFSWAPDGKRLAYEGSDAERMTAAIRVFDVATGESKPLAPGSAPRWRADGSMVAVCGPESLAPFDSDTEDAYDQAPVYDMEPRFCRIDPGSGAITRLPLAAEPGMALSSLADRVVFERYTDAAMEAAVGEATRADADFQAMADDAAGGRGRNVIEGARDLGRALETRQKKDKARAALEGGNIPEVEVFAADIDRGEPVRLAAPGEAAFPSWTQAGDRILYASRGTSGPELWTMAPDGGDRRPLLTGVKVADPASAQLSADGRHVFFVAAVGGGPGDLHVAPAGSGEARRLANTHSYKLRFAVSPDGKRIAYEVPTDVKLLSGEQNSEIWIMKGP